MNPEVGMWLVTPAVANFCPALKSFCETPLLLGRIILFGVNRLLPLGVFGFCVTPVSGVFLLPPTLLPFYALFYPVNSSPWPPADMGPPGATYPGY